MHAKCPKKCKWDVFLQPPHLVLHVSLLQLLLVEEAAQLGKLLPEKLHLRRTDMIVMIKGLEAKETMDFWRKHWRKSKKEEMCGKTSKGNTVVDKKQELQENKKCKKEVWSNLGSGLGKLFLCPSTLSFPDLRNWVWGFVCNILTNVLESHHKTSGNKHQISPNLKQTNKAHPQLSSKLGGLSLKSSQLSVAFADLSFPGILGLGIVTVWSFF